MSIIHGLRHMWRSVVNRDSADADTREELAYHIERQTQKHIAAGMSPSAAGRTAAAELGGAERWRGETNDARRGGVLLDLVADCRYAARGLASRPGFALSALSTLAIGVGATTAIFGVAQGALLRPLPFRDAARIMSISLRMPISASARSVDMVWSYPKFLLLRDRQRAFSSLALHSSETLLIDGRDGAERVAGEMAGASYFDILGVHPARGRTFTADEDRVGGSNAVVVLSDDFWKTRFAGDASAIGGTLTIRGVKHSIVGVMPPGFGGLSGDAQLWVPVPDARSAAMLQTPGGHNMELVGRVASGVSVNAAKEAVAALGARIDQIFPDNDGHWGAAAYSLADLRVNSTIRRSLELLSIAASLLLIIVCVNLTTLLVTRGAARRQEFAIRLALGAGRGRVVRQLIAESVVIAALGDLAGLPIAFVATRTLASTLPISMPAMSSSTDLTPLTFSSIHMDWRAVAFAIALSAVIGAVIGIASALRVTSSGLISALRQGSASSALSGRGLAASNGLVVAQVALAIVFLVASGLTIESLQRTLSVPLGYSPQGLLSVTFTLDPVRAQRDSTLVLWRTVVDEVRNVPGVRSVAVGSCSPLGMHCDGTSVTPRGHSGATHIVYLTASPDYFSVLKTRVLRGRAFQPTDSQHVMIINQAAAREIWGADDPLTTPAMFGDQAVQIVGVVDDARYGDLEKPAEPAMFVPFGGTRGVLFVRADGDPAALGPAIRLAVKHAGSGNALGAVTTMGSRLRDATARNRLSAQVFSAFAISALLLAAVGVYGTLALRVAQRSREFAIRRALGASGATVARAVGTQAAVIALVGGVVGIAAAMVVSRGMTALLYGVRPLETTVFIGSAALLALAVLAAAAVPTARSLRIDPRDAMRAE